MTKAELILTARFEQSDSPAANEIAALVRQLATRIQELENKARRVVDCCDREGQACAGCVGGLSFVLGKPTTKGNES